MLRLSRVIALGLCSLVATSACENRPVQDDFRSRGGTAPDPAGVIEGSVVYIGPRPTCEFDGDKPKRVIGRVILTMFRFDNPTPPEGTATSAENLLAMSGDELFSTTDCLPKGEEPDPTAEKIMRSVAFRWPQIPLQDDPIEYQVRGFYDYDADMNPFFGVSRTPTGGDIAGAALVNIQDRSKGFMRIRMPARREARDGHVARGVTVALGNYIWTERPVFKLSEKHRQLNAEEIIPVQIDFSLEVPEPHVADTLQFTWELTCATPKQPGCGLSLESLKEEEVGSTFAAAGLALDFSAERYFWSPLPVDVKTIVDGGPDLNLPDGIPDPHPILGASMRVPYMLPALILQRRALGEAAEIEAQAKIPGVLLLGAPLAGEIEAKQAFVDEMHMAVTPLAVVDLDPTNPSCRIPYVPPGNSASSYESRIATCQDLPTGFYAPSVLHGVSGGTPDDADPARSDNGFVIAGGGLSGQSWSIPNELADPEQVGEENVLGHQGTEQLFVVHDPHPGRTVNSCEKALPDEGEERPVVYRKVCEPEEKLLVESEGKYGTLKGIDGAGCLPQVCCDAVAHLCEVELCEVVELDGPNPGEKLLVRGSPTRIERTLDNGVGVPDCVPFEVPSICCD